MKEKLGNLVEDLVSDYPDGTPAIVLVSDYLERDQLAKSFVDEARLHGVNVLTLSTPEDADDRIRGQNEETPAAVVLMDAGAVTTWGPWLEANRESLPDRVRFLIVLMVPADVPVLSRLAPSFMSWAKGLEIRKLEIDQAISARDVEAEMARLAATTGMSPAEFVEAWKRGEVADDFQNAAWLNLAWAVAPKGGQ